MARNKKYTDPKLLKRIYKLRIEGLNWEAISQEVEKEFGLTIFRETIKKMYDDYLTHAHVVVASMKEDKRRAKELQIDWNKKIEEKFVLIDKMTNKFMKVLNDLFEESLKEENKFRYVKLIPVGLAVSREILNQLHFIKKQQEQIIFNQKNVIYSPLQIMNVINKEMKKQTKDNELKIIEKKTGKVKKTVYLD